MAITEKMRKKLEKRKKEIADRSSGGFNFISFKEGKTRVRILPGKPDEDFAMEVTQFWFGDKIKGMVSPATFGLPCAATEMYEELRKGDDGDKDIAKSFAPRTKIMAPMIKYKDEKGKEVDTDTGVKPGILTGGQYTELVEWMLDEDYGDFTDEKEGYDIKIIRTGKGKTDTEYKQMKMPNSKLAKEYRGKVYDIEKMIKDLLPSYEKTQEMINEFLGIANDEDDKPKKKKKKGSKDKSSKDKSGKKKKKKRTSDI